MPYDPPPELAGLTLTQIGELVAARKLPQVDAWNPEHIGDSEMRIAADGRWFHQNGEIKRAAMIRAFSSLLRREGDNYFLVTPQEKLSIQVEDAPFIAVELRSEGTGKDRQLALRLNSDDLVIVGADHIIEMRKSVPYLHVRGGLWAKLARPVYYELAELALSELNLAENPDTPGLWSNAAFFALDNAA
jgi:uncharacterized protein